MAPETCGGATHTLAHVVVALLVLCVPSCQSSAAAAPVVLWVSNPVGPNQTALVWGDSFESVVAVAVVANATSNTPTGGGDTSQVFDKTATAFKVILPDDLPANKPTQLCAVDADTKCLVPFWVNAPDTFWGRGDINLTHATTTGWMRLFGRGLSGASAVLSIKNHINRANSDGDASTRSDIIIQPTLNSTANSATWSFDMAVTPGVYSVALKVDGHNFETGVELTIVSKARQWPSTVYHVNASAWAVGLELALNATRANGGGVIMLSRGVYDMSGSIDLPPFTTLKGDSTAHVSLRWNTQGNPNPPSYLIGGNASFVVEDLSIYVTSKYNDIIRDGTALYPGVGWVKSRGVRIRRVRIRADCFYRLQERNAPPRRGISANFTYEEVGNAIKFQGSEYEITDCDLYASAFVIYLQDADVGFIARNEIYYGATAYMIDSSSNIIFEQNTIVGINLFSRGNAGGATYGGPASSFVYFAFNTIQFVFGADQEILTLDGGWSPFYGSFAAISPSGLNVTLSRDPEFPHWCSSAGHCQRVHDEWAGAAVVVLAGKGAGQLQELAVGGFKAGRNWSLVAPFPVPIDTTSIVTIFERREKCIYADNAFTDGGPFQLYGGMAYGVVTRNKGVRMGGFIAEGLNHSGMMPVWFTEFVGNSIEEGIAYGGVEGYFRMSGFYNADGWYTGPMAFGIIWRDNYANNGGFEISGAVADVIVENNTLEDSDQGLQYSQNHTERVFVRNNKGL